MTDLFEDKELYSISEVCKETNIEPYILRYWEKSVGLIKPVRIKSKQRRYSRSDIEVILKIKELIYGKKFSLAGAKKELLNQNKAHRSSLIRNNSKASNVLKDIRREVKDIIRIIK
jgi:DNA-binding transcriptional MerR regulator